MLVSRKKNSWWKCTKAHNELHVTGKYLPGSLQKACGLYSSCPLGLSTQGQPSLQPKYPGVPVTRIIQDLGKQTEGNISRQLWKNLVEFQDMCDASFLLFTT